VHGHLLRVRTLKVLLVSWSVWMRMLQPKFTRKNSRYPSRLARSRRKPR
jgi:hypothetical protein